MSINRLSNDDWCEWYNIDNLKDIIMSTKLVVFVREKDKLCVKHYLKIDDLRVKSDVELDMSRKELYDMGKYELEDGELLE